MNDQDLDARLRDIQNLGTTWIRVDFDWSAIQPNSATDYQWDMYDRLVAVAGIHHLKILATLDYTPHWARDSACETLAGDEKSAQKCSPRSASEFGDFARAAVMRYHDKSVRGWEIWNEPNLTGYWKTVQPDNTLFVDPTAYARVANAAAAEIRSYSDAAIITGGLSPLFEPSQLTGMRQSDYLAQLLPHLDKSLFNGIGIHPYSWPLLPSRTASFNAFYTVDNGNAEYNLRTTMDAAGWGDKEIWGTEYGASTIGITSTERATRQRRSDHVSESTQAKIIAQGVTDWYVKPNVGPLFVHSDSDQWLQSHKNEGGFGLRRSDGTEKPAYNALKVTAEQVNNKK
jgi:hypothetical protein